jgi:hypothetical protein
LLCRPFRADPLLGEDLQRERIDGPRLGARTVRLEAVAGQLAQQRFGHQAAG